MTEDSGRIVASKDGLRARVRERLRLISTDRASASGREACRNLEAWPALSVASELVAFSSLPREPDARWIHELAHSMGLRLVLPRIVGEDLEFARVRSGDALVRGRFGVAEPSADRAPRAIAAGAVVLVPGIAFDREGGRLGRGAGYYDRALAAVRRRSPETTVIGVGFHEQLVDRVPMAPHDMRVDGVLTDEALLWVGDSAKGSRRP